MKRVPINFTTGRAAVEVASELELDLVLLDVGLTDMTGYAVARALRVRLGSSVYIAACTAWAGAEHVEQAFAAGMDEHLMKPVAMGQLQRLLRIVAARNSVA